MAAAAIDLPEISAAIMPPFIGYPAPCPTIGRRNEIQAKYDKTNGREQRFPKKPAVEYDLAASVSPYFKSPFRGAHVYLPVNGAARFIQCRPL